MRNLRIALLTALCLTLVPTFCHAATNYIVSAVPNGEILVNQTNGQIIQCVGLSTSTSLLPVGKCAQIGTTATASLSGNVSISSNATSDLVVIMNTSTGYVTECEISYSLAGEPTGACIEANS
jgi:hypothetical protein